MEVRKDESRNNRFLVAGLIDIAVFLARSLTVVENRGIHQDWDPAGNNKNVQQRGVWYFHVGTRKQSDIKLAGKKKDQIYY